MVNLLAALDILGLLSRGCGGGGLSIKWVATEIGGPKRRLLGVVYFYLKSNLPRLINDFDEGSDSVPGDGERKKRERERYQVYLDLGQRRERAGFQPWLGREGGFLCALFRAEVLTEGP